MKDIRKAEYDMLREASWKRMDVQRNISLFVITATLTVFSIGFAMDKVNKYIFLLPIIILLPSAAKVYQCKNAISCIGAYMIVFLENRKNSYRWETDSYIFKNAGMDFQNKKLISLVADIEFFLLSVVSITIYSICWYWEVCSLKNMLLDVGGVVLWIIAFILVCTIFFITKQFSLFNKRINKYIWYWNKYALERKRICPEEYIHNLEKYDLEKRSEKSEKESAKTLVQHLR